MPYRANPFRANPHAKLLNGLRQVWVRLIRKVRAAKKRK